MVLKLIFIKDTVMFNVPKLISKMVLYKLVTSVNYNVKIVFLIQVIVLNANHKENLKVFYSIIHVIIFVQMDILRIIVQTNAIAL